MPGVGDAGDLWSSFPLDPRDRDYADLRASDDDRERIRAALGTAFADGRLDHDELEERLSAASEARTLGELVPIVIDLVPVKPPPTRSSRSLVGVAPATLERLAVDEWQDQRRNAFFTFVGSGLICWAIWVAVNLGGGDVSFPWPLIVNAVTLLNLVKTAASREQFVRDEVRRLEKKQARQQKWPRGLT